MNDLIPELKDLLSHHLLDSPYDPESRHREKFLIDHLAFLVRQWEVGDISLEELVASFRSEPLGNFDILSWIQSKTDEGEYAE